MLVLTRNVGQRIFIGEGPEAIVVTILGVSAGKASVGVDAPRELPVHREEVVSKIVARRENAA